jgi:DNA-binding XRE family transcriptional regulator
MHSTTPAGTSLLKVLRVANGLTQQELADRVNRRRETISLLERDGCAPQPRTARAIADELGVAVGTLWPENSKDTVHSGALATTTRSSGARHGIPV